MLKRYNPTPEEIEKSLLGKVEEVAKELALEFPDISEEKITEIARGEIDGLVEFFKKVPETIRTSRRYTETKGKKVLVWNTTEKLRKKI